MRQNGPDHWCTPLLAFGLFFWETEINCDLVCCYFCIFSQLNQIPPQSHDSCCLWSLYLWSLSALIPLEPQYYCWVALTSQAQPWLRAFSCALLCLEHLFPAFLPRVFNTQWKQLFLKKNTHVLADAFGFLKYFPPFLVALSGMVSPIFLSIITRAEVLISYMLDLPE